MTGSSVDAIDAALVHFDSGAPQLIKAVSKPFSPDTRNRIIQVTHGEPCSVSEICSLDAKIGAELADAAQDLIDESDIEAKTVVAIGSHGQTVCHLPDETPSGTMQLGDAAQIAERTGITTVADFRHRDMAAGGQGAPFAPVFHAAVLRSDTEDRCVVNLGGIANVTVLPKQASAPVVGFDTGPASALLDLWSQKNIGKRFDRDGEWSSGGTVIESLLQLWLDDTFFHRQPPKSTGRDYFDEHWLNAKLAPAHNAQDVQATLAELSAHTVADAVKQHAPQSKRVLICGGGVNNRDLLARIQRHLDDRIVESTSVHGVDPHWVEAMMIAWLTARTLSGLPGNLPSVTGAAGERICGAIYPA